MDDVFRQFDVIEADKDSPLARLLGALNVCAIALEAHLLSVHGRALDGGDFAVVKMRLLQGLADFEQSRFAEKSLAVVLFQSPGMVDFKHNYNEINLGDSIASPQG